MTRWYTRLSLRSRLMVVGLTGVAVALLLGGLLLYAAMTAALSRAVESEARATAETVAALANEGRLPDPVPISGAQVVQVLDEQHRVTAGSVTADRLTPLVTAAELSRLLDGRTFTVPGSRAGLGGDLQLAAVRAGPSAEPVVVVAAAPTADLDTSRRVLRTILLVFFPLFMLALALVAWRVIGSALRPVEQLRHGAEQIGEGSSESERLPVPPSRDEVSALATTLNGMLDRLATARTKQRSFVADAAHELRSPLASMRTQLEVAARLGEGGGLPADLLPEVGRLSTLVEDLLVLARTGDDAHPPRSEDIGLTALLGQVAERYAGARVPVHVADGPAGPGSTGPVVAADPADLLRAVGNLVDNAVRHAGTAVRLAARATAMGAELSVTDDGHGIPEAVRERVFDRFARLDEARDRDSGGSGLGLAITRELLRRNGAHIRLEDASPGLRAVVTFPKA
jgi:signal transduction histidine kinase